MSPRILLVLPAVACSWEVPLDTGGAPVANVIEGTVVLSGLDEPAETWLALYASDDPPPPDGTGRPAGLTAVAAEELAGEPGGLYAGSFAFTGVPDGDWLVTALVDTDHDFHPLVDYRAGATCGDVLGAAVADLETQDLATVSVSGGERRRGVAVVAGSAVPFERPAFRFSSNQVSQTDPGTYAFGLVSVGVYTEDYTLTGPADLSDPKAYDPCDTQFVTMATDADGDGLPDPHPTYGDAVTGAYDIWPRIYLEYVGPIDSEGGVVLEEGESYVSEAIVDPTAWLPASMGGSGSIPVNTVQPQTSLTAIFVPVARHVLPDGSSETLSVAAGDNLPRGKWAVTVVSPTGQTWTLPNGLAEATSTDDSFSAITQGAFLVLE